ncbi:Copia protein [Gossypium australe]|uniref:Copia protein n=1 Tax=Gossypium australe TaxID=47621 RepID=A0A5B6W8N6_9ROSI|nr:Copia protein [Gossypium australe]
MSILLHVDDITITGDICSKLDEVIQCLDQKFALKDLEELNYFLGLEVTLHGDCVHVSQQKYASELLQQAHMANAKPMNTPMVSSPTLRYLVGSHLLDGTFVALTGFFDVDWTNSLEDHKSTFGFCQYLGDNIIGWSSKKQIVAEYRSLANFASELTWYRSLLDEIEVKCNNSSTVSLAVNPVLHARVKHVELDMHFVREKVLSRQLQVNYVSGCDQVADVLTKPLTVGAFTRCQDRMNVLPVDSLCREPEEGILNRQK